MKKNFSTALADRDVYFKTKDNETIVDNFEQKIWARWSLLLKQFIGVNTKSNINGNLLNAIEFMHLIQPTGLEFKF